MKNIIKGALFCPIGLASTVLGIVCYCLYDGSYVSRLSYGGDAYTGIQNAAAQTASNVEDLAIIAKFGFGSVLLITGLVLIVLGITSFIKEGGAKAAPAPAIVPAPATVPAPAVVPAPAIVPTVRPAAPAQPAETDRPAAEKPAETAETILERFRGLLAEGIITQEEYDKKEAELKGADRP